MEERRKNNLIGAAYGVGAMAGVFLWRAGSVISEHGRYNYAQFDDAIKDTRNLVISQDYPSQVDIENVYDQFIGLTNLDLIASERQVEEATGKLEFFLDTYDEDEVAEPEQGRAILVDTREQILKAQAREDHYVAKMANTGFLLGIILLGYCGFKAVQRIYLRKPSKKPSSEPTTS